MTQHTLAHSLKTIVKRDGRIVAYDATKILKALQKAFDETSTPYTPEALEQLLHQVEHELEGCPDLTVEHIQDIVELTLMSEGHYEVAKAYILYRSSRTKQRMVRDQLTTDFPSIAELPRVLSAIERDYPDDAYHLDQLTRKYHSFRKTNDSEDVRLDHLIRAATELIEQEAPEWQFIASRLFGLKYQRQLERNWTTELGDSASTAPPLTFADRVRHLFELGLYGDAVPETYTDDALNEAATWADPERDHLLTIAGYELLVDRYVIRTGRHVALESIQDMFLGIALFLAVPEPAETRMAQARIFYDMLSQLQVTMATPTLANARKAHHQLSSCFIDTVPDDLAGIYRSISNFANVSKFGGGMGLYFGKVRAQGSAIRGFEGAAGGVIRWIKLANDTAVAVDQLGVRQGACACYLDVWHKDLPEFLDLRTNNGDDRMKAHDIFPGVCYPDYFWEQVRVNMNGKWGLLCPHEVLTKKGYALEDSFGDEWRDRYLDCLEDPEISKRWIPIKDVVRAIIHSMIETGTPFTFNRDHVNRANPNKDKGVIYCSNLCTEIAQNMAPATDLGTTIQTQNGETVIVQTTQPGSYVVCNLASLNLGALDVQNDAMLQHTIHAVVRALDNVITMNHLPVADAEYTNRNYRAIGLGVSGYHHMLAQAGIPWESDEHLRYVDEVFERINYHSIAASHQLALEKGAYPLFEGSEWANGRYFEERGYTSEAWQTLKRQVMETGLRNGYLLAIAPTASTSIISGTTAGIDPLMERFYYDEKKSGLIARVAPDLRPETYWLYKGAHQIDQTWSIRAASVRTRHIDQASSMNLYITQDYSFRSILELYLLAHEEGIKTVYYVRSKSLEVEDCISCAT